MNVYVHYTTTTTSSITGRQRCWLHFQPPKIKKCFFIFIIFYLIGLTGRKKKKSCLFTQLVDFDSIQVITRKWLHRIFFKKNVIWYMVDSGACVHCPRRKTWTTSRRQNNNSAGARHIRLAGIYLSRVVVVEQVVVFGLLPGYRSLITLNVDIPDSVLLFCIQPTQQRRWSRQLNGGESRRLSLSLSLSMDVKCCNQHLERQTQWNQPTTHPTRPIDYFTFCHLYGVESSSAVRFSPLLVSTPAAHAS